MSATAESVEISPRAAVPGAARTLAELASSASCPPACRRRPRVRRVCTKHCATARSAAASACAPRSSTRPRARSAFPNRASTASPARWNSSTPTRSCTTTCRRWTTTICAAAGRRATRRSTKRRRSWSAMRCRCSRSRRSRAVRDCPPTPRVRLELVRLLAVASGTGGMAGGQALDLAAVGRQLSLAEVEEMHARKTGALIHASRDDGRGLRRADLGAPSRGRSTNSRAPSASRFRSRTTCSTSKATRRCSARRPARIAPTTSRRIPPVVGVEAARRRMHELHARALGCARVLGLARSAAGERLATGWCSESH